jgi:hypothetical protein
MCRSPRAVSRGRERQSPRSGGCSPSRHRQGRGAAEPALQGPLARAGEEPLRQEELRRESCRAREELRRVPGSGDGGDDEAESGSLAWLELVR